MARNIREMAIKAFTVNYGVVENGKVQEHTATFETNSERKIMRAISERHGVNPAQLFIISTSEQETKYRVLDMVKALQMLADAGLAEVVTDKPEQPQKQEQKQEPAKKSA